MTAADHVQRAIRRTEEADGALPPALGSTDTDSPEQAKIAEGRRNARGWMDTVRLAERIRRQDAGEPLIRIER